MSNWTEEEKEKLSDIGFSPYYGDEDDYRLLVSYSDYIYDTVYKNNDNSYNATKHEKEYKDSDDYDWISSTEEFDSFESLTSFLNN